MHASGTWLALALITFALVGCQSATEYSPRSKMALGQSASEDVIRRKIVGTWYADAESFDGLVTFTFSPDGRFVSRDSGGVLDQARYWRADKGCVVVTPENDGIVSHGDQFITVYRVDDGELICRPGISVAGYPLRFTK